jgi:hypothetical protein
VREAIRVFLDTLSIKVYQPHVITKTTLAPYCVLTFDEIVNDVKISSIHNGSLTLWCYHNDENYEQLDTLRKTVMTIDKKILTTASSFKFKLEFINKIADFYDSEWDKIGCNLSFKYVDYIP